MADITSVYRCYKWISSLQDHPDGKYLKNISPPQLNKTYRICSSHFSLKNYQGNKLLKVAIPDQNMCEEASGSCTMGNDSGSDGNSSWNTFYFGIPSDLPGHSSEEEISVTSNNYEKVQHLYLLVQNSDPDGNPDLQTNSRKRKGKTSSKFLHGYRTRVKRLLRKVDVLKQGALFNKKQCFTIRDYRYGIKSNVLQSFRNGLSDVRVLSIVLCKEVQKDIRDIYNKMKL
nr:uncharacterized protein LOC113816294 [Penaeus vannamei]